MRQAGGAAGLIGRWAAILAAAGAALVGSAEAQARTEPSSPRAAVAIASPAAGFATNARTLAVTVAFGTASGDDDWRDRHADLRTLVLLLDGREAGVFRIHGRVESGVHVFTVDLSTRSEGVVTLQALGFRGAERPSPKHVVSSDPVSIVLDRTPPSVDITAPAGDQYVTGATVHVAGSASDSLSGVAAVTCSGTPASLSAGAFSCDVPLVEGANTIVVRAQDRAGNQRTASIVVHDAPGGLAGDGAAFGLDVVHDFIGDTSAGGDHLGIDAASGLPVQRTSLAIAFAPDASVAQVDDLLASIQARIVGMLDGVAILNVEIPDPGSMSALAVVVDQLNADSRVRYVVEGFLPQEQDLPPNLDPTAVDLPFVSNNLAVRAGAAWNARKAIAPADSPTVVILDGFGSGTKLPIDGLDADVTGAPFGDVAGDEHGVSVAGVIGASFGPSTDHSPRAVATGIYPARSRMVFVDTDRTGMNVPQSYDLLITAVRSAVSGGHVVVNTSLGACDRFGHCPTLREVNLMARLWIEDVRGTSALHQVGAGLEDAFLQVSAAGNINVAGENPDAVEESGWNAAAHLPNLVDGNGDPIPNLTNTLVVENAVDSGDIGIECLSTVSKRPGDVSGVGTDVWVLTATGAEFENGTSFSAPQVAGLAEYLWTLDPRPSPQQLAGLLRATAGSAGASRTPLPLACDPSTPPAPPIDAYTAILSLDAPAIPDPASAPIRRTLLDADGNGQFDETDLSQFDTVYTTLSPQHDYGRLDLNGDGFTGGDTTAAFDLDRIGSTLWGASGYSVVTQNVLGLPVAYDEHRLTDLDIVCYYANSPLYTGDAAARDTFDANDCLPAVSLTGSLPPTITASTPVTLTLHVDRLDFPLQGQTVGQRGVRLELTPTGGSLDDVVGSTDANGDFHTTAHVAAGASALSVDVVARAGAGGPVLATTHVQASVTSPGANVILVSRLSSADAFARAVAFSDGGQFDTVDSHSSHVTDFRPSASLSAAASTIAIGTGIGTGGIGEGTASAGEGDTIDTAGGALLHLQTAGNCTATAQETLVDPNANPFGDAVGFGTGSGTFEVRFRVVGGPVRYHFIGFLAVDELEGVGDARLFSVAESKALVEIGTRSGSVDETGVLGPGEYVASWSAGCDVSDDLSASGTVTGSLTLTANP